MATSEQKRLTTMKARVAEEKLYAAELAWAAYARECDVGTERTRAFDVLENVRNATRVR